MLPFLNKNRQRMEGGMATVVRKPDEGKEPEQDHGLLAAATDLHDAIKTGDMKAISGALRSAFLILESEPHYEAEHTNE